MTNDLGLGEPFHLPKNANVDIVFVHGLGGHRLNTWTTKPTDEEPEEICWPKDFLHKACPSARILSFGYDASFAHFYPLYGPKDIPVGTTIDDHSASLFLALSNLRESDNTPPSRPILFVAHSLGGLVVANALSRPHVSNASNVNLVDSTYGAVFLGTPFEGAAKAKWGERGLKLAQFFSTTNTEKVKELQERSQKLASINDNFAKLIKARDQSSKQLKIACFYETHSTYIKKVNIGLVVPRESASLSGIDPTSVAATHSGMCKFAEESRDGYRNITGILKRWIKEFDETLTSGSNRGPYHGGDMNFHSSVQNHGILVRDVDGYTPHAVSLIGSNVTNHYGSECRPSLNP